MPFRGRRLLPLALERLLRRRHFALRWPLRLRFAPRASLNRIAFAFPVRRAKPAHGRAPFGTPRNLSPLWSGLGRPFRFPSAGSRDRLRLCPSPLVVDPTRVGAGPARPRPPSRQSPSRSHPSFLWSGRPLDVPGSFPTAAGVPLSHGIPFPVGRVAFPSSRRSPGGVGLLRVLLCRPIRGVSSRGSRWLDFSPLPSGMASGASRVLRGLLRTSRWHFRVPSASHPL